MSALPVLHSTNMVNQAVQFETDLSRLRTPIPDGTLIYARDSQVVFVFNPTSAAGNVPGVSRIANGGGAFLAIANLSSLGGTVEYFDTVQGGMAGQVGLKDTVPTTTVGAIVGGNASSQDGLAGDAWFWDPTSVQADDGQTVIRPTSLPLAGRWIRIANQFIGYTQGVAVNVLTASILLNNDSNFIMQMHDNNTVNGKSVTIAAGATTVPGNPGGDLFLKAGDGSGAGADGSIRIFTGTSEGGAGTEIFRFAISAGITIATVPITSGITFSFNGKAFQVSQASSIFLDTNQGQLRDSASGAIAFAWQDNQRGCLSGDPAVVLAGTNGVKVTGIINATTVPTVNPVGGGVLYGNAGALTYRGSGGTVTVLAPA